MRSTRKTMVLSGVLLIPGLFCGATAAQGFGPQWRPASDSSFDQPASVGRFSGSNVAYASTPMVQRIANVPSFRPHSTRLAQRYAELKHRPSQDIPPFASAHVPAFPQYQRYASYQPYAAPTPLPPMTSPQFAPPIWGGPFAQMAHAFPNPMPMIGRTFAWSQPGDQWSSHAPVPTGYYGQRAMPVRPVASYRDTGPASAAVYPGAFPGNWRPVAQARLQPVQPWSASAYPGHSQARLTVPQVAVASRWRPDTDVGSASLSRYASNFRPAAYGRSTQLAQTVSAGPARGNLPGWVTTFNDSEESCSWCSGS